MPEPATLPPETDAAVIAAARAHFAACRSRVDPFVARTFGLRGTLALHRAAIGWDVLRAPANVALAPLLVLTRLLAALARAVGLGRVSGWLVRRRILLRTAVAREVEARILAELLCLTPTAGRASLAGTILSAPEVRAYFRRRGGPGAAREVAEAAARALDDYGGTRSAVGEITTTLGVLGAGAIAFQAVTPGMISIAPALAAILAQGAAVASFPLGAALGAGWYWLFPVEIPFWLGVAATAGLLAAAALAATFAGILADPVQARLGIHRRRLLRLIDALEAEFTGEGRRGFVAREHYLARLADLADAGVAAARMLVP